MSDTQMIAGSEETFAAAETLDVRERVVVSPCSGRFSPLPAETITSEGEWVEPGQVLARILNGGEPTPVCSQFRGWLMGMLGVPGQPVREGEALFWVWSC